MLLPQKIRNYIINKLDPKLPTEEILFDYSILYGANAFNKYNPDDLLFKKGLDVYTKMMRDDQVKAVMEFKIHSIACRKYTFYIDNDDPKQEEISKFFEYLITEIKGSWTDVLQNILTALKNGFSISEKIYKPIEWEKKPYWGIKDIKTRDVRGFYNAFDIDEYGNIKNIYQQIESGRDTPISPNKVIHFIHQPWIDAHYGESDLRAMYRSYWSKDILIKFQNIFLERFAGGFIWAKTKGMLDPNQKANLENVLKNISARLGIMVPDNVELNVSDPKSSDAFERAIAQHDKAIAKSALVPNLLGLSEQGDTGSYAQSKIQLDAFFIICDAISNRLDEILNEQLFKELALFNFGAKEYPKYKTDSLTKEQKIELAKVFIELTKGNSITKNDNDEIYIRKILNLPEMEKKEEEEEGEEGKDDNINGQDNRDASGDDNSDNSDNIDNNDDNPNNPNSNNNPDNMPNNDNNKKFAQLVRPWDLRVNYKAYKEAWDSTENKLIDGLNYEMGQVKMNLYTKIEKIIGNRPLRTIDFKEFKELKIPAKLLNRVKTVIGDNLQLALIESHNLAYKELPQKFAERVQKKVIKPGKDIGRADKFLRDKKFYITDIMEKDILDASQQVLANSIKYDKNLKQTLLALDEDVKLSGYLPTVDGAGKIINKAARIETIARTNMAEAVNIGRQTVFNHPDVAGYIQAYQYSAVLDDRVSDICETLDGRIQKDWGVYMPPKHFNCRSILVPITTLDNWNGKEDNIPSSAKPLKGFS